MKIIVTGCAGFIGSHVSEYLLKRGDIVIGIDSMNNYYNINIKNNNINLLKTYSNFTFICENILNSKVVENFKPDKICHLASMAGVRYSLENPCLYIRENIEGFTYLLSECVKYNIKYIVYASSSSVYGLNKNIPFKETDSIEKCNSPYACSKRAMEILASTYNQLYNINTIGLRFFTVYGPRGRPDMAPYKFLNAIMNGETFEKYGNGNSQRDYTYIDDIVSGVIASLDNINNISCEIFNLGNSNTISLNKFIKTCEKVTDKTANYINSGDKLGDVPYTCADISKAKELLGYNPKTSLVDGLKNTYNFLKNNKNLYNSTETEYKYCVLGDCSSQDCHHCFPVKNCNLHKICIKEGCCDLYIKK